MKNAAETPRMGYIDEVLDRWERAPSQRPAPHAAFLHLGHWDEPPASAKPEDLPTAQARLNEHLLSLAELTDGMSVVDVGCGVGATLAVIAQRHTHMRLCGVNRDDRQLELARRSVSAGQNELAFVRADACAIPLPAGSVDRVLAVESIFHFGSRAAFFDEVVRLLRPGGRLVFSDFVPADSLREERHAFPAFAIEALLEDGLGAIPDPFGREGVLVDLARRAGLASLRVVDATANVMPSYDCLLWQGERRVASLDALDRAVATLRWLARTGLMRMEYHVYRREA